MTEPKPALVELREELGRTNVISDDFRRTILCYAGAAVEEAFDRGKAANAAALASAEDAAKQLLAATDGLRAELAVARGSADWQNRALASERRHRAAAAEIAAASEEDSP